MTHTWKTQPNGSVTVDGDLPELQGGLPEQVWRWWELSSPLCKQHDVPLSWVLGTIYRESGGNPAAASSDGGMGLMQITHPSLKAGRSDAQLLEPSTNLEIGIAFMGRLRKMGDPWARSLPAVASKFNAGAQRNGNPWPSSSGPWGMRETSGHVSAVVAANNSAIRRIELEAARGGLGSDTLAPFLLTLQALRLLMS